MFFKTKSELSIKEKKNRVYLLNITANLANFQPNWAELALLKVSKSQNKFMKSSFLPKNERNIARISALTFRAEILAIFRSFFGKNDGFIKVF